MTAGSEPGETAGDAAQNRTARPGLYVISAPSGAGKTSLVKALLERAPLARMSVSYTTRTQRETEVDGSDYFFVDEAAFRARQQAGDFLEHANVFGNLYGTSRSQVDELIARGLAVILEIDWQGARQVRAAAGDCLSVFILPPSLEELERRLRGRSTDSDEVIARRLSQAVDDISHWAEFDFVVVNDDFENAAEELKAIVRGQGESRRADRPGLRPVVEALLA